MNESLVLVRWNPTRNSGVAFLTLLGMTIAYAVMGWSGDNVAVWAVVGLLVVPLLSVGVPVYWTTVVERRPISALGITVRHWLPSLLLGLLLSLERVSPLLFARPPTRALHEWLPMAVIGIASLFEPLFVFGWLQLRFEKDFGVLPAVLLAALGFAVYHIGFMPEQMSAQFGSAVLYGVAFRLTNNLLVTWPLLWGTTSAMLCIGQGVCFADWGFAATYVVLAALEIVYIALLSLRQRRAAARSLDAA
jgi:membrane protease YdiL (CAAX protease family)